MGYEDLTPEQKEKLKACKTPEEIRALVEAEGYELSEDELASVSGGLVPDYAGEDKIFVC